MRLYYDPATLLEMGLLLKTRIMERTEKGLDKNNQPFADYSTNTFALPLGALQKGVRKTLEAQNKIHYFKRNRVLFAAVEGGYKYLKKLQYAKTSYDGTVNLTATGQMWRDFDVLSARGETVRLGFTRPQSAKIMYYNIQRGRDPLGISNQDTDLELQAILAQIKFEL